jgi:2-polyprenyl-6-methoxyphenol hydroxylase-like FAD-dependent oxidoreductase
VEGRTSSREAAVLIVGAGPTGLVLALWLTRLGVQVRIVDQAEQTAATSRALAVQARTLELYQQMGLAETVAARGRRAVGATMWVKGRKVGRAVFGDMGVGISPYPYALIYPQDEHERLLIDRLREAGVEVERRIELLTVEETNGRVVARLKRADGQVEACQASYVAGCDGAHSAVREALAVGFPGGTYAHVFYVADVEASGPAINGDVHVAFDRADFLAVFPLKGDGRARFVGTLRQDAERDHDAEHDHENVSWNDVSKRVIDWMRVDVAAVNWFSTYRVHHRVAGRFRVGRAFLLGDAAHIHSPVGGQGMNTGIGDAVNLAWKLAAVLRGAADPAILDTYETERIAFARRLVATTDRAFTAVTSTGTLARVVRLRLVPLVIPRLFRSRAVRRLVFRTISQTAIHYRQSALSEGRAAHVHGGDRLPWVRTGADAADNFAPLTSLNWQAHVYGDAAPDVRVTCRRRGLPLHVFAWHPAMRRSGLMRDALYLVRPDGYVGLAVDGDAATVIATMASYLDARRIAPIPH